MHKLAHTFQRLALSLFLIACAGAWLARGPAGAALAQTAADYTNYIPLLRWQNVTYLNAGIANPSFEDENWITLQPSGNQQPAGWQFYTPARDEVMPFPTKMQEGSVVPAISGGPGEYKHLYWHQLPPDEQLGAECALVIDGGLTYKAFGGVPQALRLSQTISGTAGNVVRVTGYIVGETRDTPAQGNDALEDDHFVAQLRLGDAVDKRLYAEMVQNFDVPNNGRAWNLFAVTNQFPASGTLELEIIVQQNWAGTTGFFLDAFSAVQWAAGSAAPALAAPAQARNGCIK